MFSRNKKKVDNKEAIIKNIEKDKEGRAKCIFYFTMSLTEDEKKHMRKELKELINSFEKKHIDNNED